MERQLFHAIWRVFENEKLSFYVCVCTYYHGIVTDKSPEKKNVVDKLWIHWMISQRSVCYFSINFPATILSVKCNIFFFIMNYQILSNIYRNIFDYFVVKVIIDYRYYSFITYILYVNLHVLIYIFLYSWKDNCEIILLWICIF